MNKSLLAAFEEASRHYLVSVRWIEITGDLVAGILLSQVVYWFRPNRSGGSRLRVSRDGREWIAKSRDEWRAELGISPKQFDRAADHLVELGVVTRGLFKFRGRPVPHLSLNLPQLDAFLKCYLEGVGLYPKGKIDFTQRSKSTFPKGQSHIHRVPTESTTETKNGGTTSSPATTGVDYPKSIKVAKMKAEEQLALFLKKHKPEKGHPEHVPIKNTMQLAVWWERLVPYYFDGPVKPLTKKEIGMLGHFRKYVADNPYDVMKWAIEHWNQFLVDASEQTGDTLSAKVPQVGLLLKHYPVAVAGWVNSKAPKKTKQVVSVN